jgi:ribosomal RNA-processing protein 7
MAPEASVKAKKSTKTPKTVGDFTILPLTLPTLTGLTEQCSEAKHYIYVKPQEQNISTPDDDRSLFVANIPIDASDSNIRGLFQEQLGGSMVERVEFDASVPAEPMHKRWKSDQPRKDAAGGEQRGKKRKRTNADDAAVIAEGVVEDADSALPKLWPTGLRRSGSGAVVVFVDKKSARGALKEVQRAVKESRTIHWESGEVLGVERKSISQCSKSHAKLTQPPRIPLPHNPPLPHALLPPILHKRLPHAI